MEDTWVWSW